VTKSGAISFLWRKKKMQSQLEALMQEIGTPDAVCMLSLSEKLLLTHTLTHSPNSKFKIQNSVYWIEHDPIGRWLTGNPWLPRLRRLSKRATTIVVSHLSRDHYLRLGWNHDKTVAIQNGIDFNRIGDPLPRKRSSKDEPLRLGCIARLSPEKGVDVLLQAMSDLPPHVTLAIAGTGKQERMLRRLTDTLGLQDRVTFLLPESDIRGLYEQFDAFVLPSRAHDPFGLTVAEAMALGLPAVVTDACGIAGSVNGTEALVVPAGSAEALKDGILHLLEPETFNHLAQNGSGTAREKFSLERMVQSYENVFTGTPLHSPPS
jgi:glycosyltransferase involved in cell wall biosynthesis